MQVATLHLIEDRRGGNREDGHVSTRRSLVEASFVDEHFEGDILRGPDLRDSDALAAKIRWTCDAARARDDERSSTRSAACND